MKTMLSINISKGAILEHTLSNCPRMKHIAVNGSASS